VSICCPKCGKEGKVIETRKRDGIAVRRRRCIRCIERWTTWEAGDNSATAASVRMATLKKMREAIDQIERA